MNKLENDHYTYEIIWSEEDREFVGLCVEFPSLSCLATSKNAALDGIKSLVYNIVTDMKENDEILF